MPRPNEDTFDELSFAVCDLAALPLSPDQPRTPLDIAWDDLIRAARAVTQFEGIWVEKINP